MDARHKITRNTAGRISLIYLVLGGLWIVLSDRILAWLVGDPWLLTRFQTVKGWGFVLATAGTSAP